MRAPNFSFFKNVTVLWRTFKNYHWQIGALILLGIVSAALDGIGVNAVIPLISFYTNSGSLPTDFISRAIAGLFGLFNIPFTFRYLLAFILVLFMMRAAVMTFSGYIRGWISADFLGKESEMMLARMLRTSWPFLLMQKIGTLQATLMRDIQRSENMLQVFGQIIQSFSGFFIYLLILFNISPSMTVSAVAAAGFLFLIARPFLARSQRMADRLAVTEKSYTQFLTEHISGIKAVKAAGVEERAVESGGVLLRLLRALSIRMALVRSISTSLFQPASLVFVIILFAIEYRQPDFNVISFAAALYLIQKMFVYLESGQGALHSVRETVPYVQNVEAFKQRLEAHREQGHGEGSARFEDAIEFKNVSFAYEEKRPVLENANFIIRRGQTIGLVGPSGAGKTSIADLLLKLFTPTSGEILIDGQSLNSVPLEAWRQRIGYVAQDVFLLNASIEENIRFYRSALSKEDIVAATKQANIHDFITSLPEGLSTVVGDRGVMLSGGQRQRIALARALAGSPALLVLDEATSALDAASEKLIQDSLQALHGSVTIVIIAHRLSTIEHADWLLVLDRGKIIEQGSPQELFAQPDSYVSRHRPQRS